MSEDLPEPPAEPVEVILPESERIGVQHYREKELRRKQQEEASALPPEEYPTPPVDPEQHEIPKEQ